MSYADGRTIHDADAHVMEPPDWLVPYADPGLRERVAAALAGDDHYSLAVDGRFKGGYITRQYGRPDDNIHAFQLELSLATYMEEDPPFTFRDDLANRVRPSLRRMLETALDWAEGRKGKAP